MTTEGLRCEYCGTVTNGELHRVTVCRDVLRADLALATAQRPVEPPSVVTASGWRVRFETEKRTFHLKSALMTGTSAYANSVSEVARRIMTTDEELDAIRTLRDGPTARYEVCGWQVRDYQGQPAVSLWPEHYGNDIAQCERIAKDCTEVHDGGTAHAIYKRVDVERAK